MSKKGSGKIVFISLVLMILVVTLGNQVFGASGGKPAIQPLQIQSVTVNFSDGTIHIDGQNFVNGATPVVTIGSTNLSVKSYVSGEIVAELPASTAAGDYLLVVSTGSATAQNDKYDLTIGVPGLMGVNCAVGQVLAQTASGWQCRSLAVFQNAVGPCGSGGCDLTCSYGWGNCDSNYTNGCETSLLDDRSNCGSCGKSCPSLQTCVSGVCSCAPNMVLCNGTCTLVDRDPNNCGACGIVCPSGQICSSGVCTISCPGQTNCNGICKDLSSDPSNCGSCGNVCPSGQVCSAGVCSISCPDGQTDCRGVCTDLSVDPNNCGSCGTLCPSGQCSLGVCTPISCPTGQSNCSGVCTDLSVDPNNCGSCGNACSVGRICSLGVCCPSGQTNCSGVCRDLFRDPSNCGSCGAVCESGQICSGICGFSCPSGQTNCSGWCTNLDFDPYNCGGCGKSCLLGQVCVSGGCY